MGQQRLHPSLSVGAHLHVHQEMVIVWFVVGVDDHIHRSQLGTKKEPSIAIVGSCKGPCIREFRPRCRHEFLHKSRRDCSHFRRQEEQQTTKQHFQSHRTGFNSFKNGGLLLLVLVALIVLVPWIDFNERRFK
jgi:hypothetical protein